MIECESCGKRHRTQEGVARCRERAERTAARLEKRVQDYERRVQNWSTEPPPQFIRRRLRDGVNFDRVVSDLNKDYPPPEGEDRWSLWNVVYTDSERFDWGVPTEVVTELRLERFMTGDWLTIHPLRLFKMPEEVVSIGSLQEQWWDSREKEVR